MSHDFEDIIFFVDHNKDLVNEVKIENSNAKRFIKLMSKEILSHSSTNEIIECHLNPYTAEVRRKIIIDKPQNIAEM